LFSAATAKAKECSEKDAAAAATTSRFHFFFHKNVAEKNQIRKKKGKKRIFSLSIFIISANGSILIFGVVFNLSYNYSIQY